MTHGLARFGQVQPFVLAHGEEGLGELVQLAGLLRIDQVQPGQGDSRLGCLGVHRIGIADQDRPGDPLVGQRAGGLDGALVGGVGKDNALPGGFRLFENGGHEGNHGQVAFMLKEILKKWAVKATTR